MREITLNQVPECEDPYRPFQLRRGIRTFMRKVPDGGEYTVFKTRQLGDVTEYECSIGELVSTEPVQLVWLWIFEHQSMGRTVIVAPDKSKPCSMTKSLWLVANTDVYNHEGEQLVHLRRLAFTGGTEAFEVTEELNEHIFIESLERRVVVTEQARLAPAVLNIRFASIRETFRNTMLGSPVCA